MNEEIEILKWDSDFFGYKVARLSSSVASGTALATAYRAGVELLYWVSQTERQIRSDFYDFTLVDCKTIYFKTIGNSLSQEASIKSFEGSKPTDDLIKLAIESGVNSRFNVDKKIGRPAFEALYQRWIEASVEKKIAKEVLVFEEAGHLAGFVTLGEKNGRADVGIIAVDADFRGQGIGKKLMQTAENWFVAAGYETMQVVTQGNNTTACRLYESCGFTVDEVSYFYHGWKK